MDKVIKIYLENKQNLMKIPGVWTTAIFKGKILVYGNYLAKEKVPSNIEDIDIVFRIIAKPGPIY